jgi:hypothetical protein
MDDNAPKLTPKQRVAAFFPNAAYKANTDGKPGGYIYFESDERVGTIPKSSGCIGEGLTAALAWKDALRSLPNVVVGVDPAAPNGDYGAETTVQVNDDGTLEVLDVKLLPAVIQHNDDNTVTLPQLGNVPHLMIAPRPRLGPYGRPLKPKGLRWERQRQNGGR